MDSISLHFPEEALQQPTVITITKLSDSAPEPYLNFSSLYRFEPEGLELARPVKFGFPIADPEDPFWLFWSAEEPNRYDTIDFVVENERAYGEITTLKTGFLGAMETVQDTYPAGEMGGMVDILFVIDNSCSMYEEQTALGHSFDDIINPIELAGLDFHVGVVSTDMDDPRQSGKLRQAGGLRYLDNSTPDITTAFRSMAQMGTSSSYAEKGRAATFAAIEELGDGFNKGFYREDAHLAVVVLSDEDDYSGSDPVTRAQFIRWMKTLKASEDMVSFNSIVGPLGNCSTAAEEGTDYLVVTDQVGGTHTSICSRRLFHSVGYCRRDSDHTV